MKYDELREFINEFRDRPLRVALLALLLVVLLGVGWFLKSYLEERGRIAAQPPTGGMQGKSPADQTRRSETSKPSPDTDHQKKDSLEQPVTKPQSKANSEPILVGPPTRGTNRKEPVIPSEQTSALRPPIGIYPPHGAKVLREKSLGEFIGYLKNAWYGATSLEESRARTSELYVGRWVRKPGWTGSVDAFPERTSSGGWSFPLVNQTNHVTFLFAVPQDMSDIRPGEQMTFLGRVDEILRPDPNGHFCIRIGDASLTSAEK